DAGVPELVRDGLQIRALQQTGRAKVAAPCRSPCNVTGGSPLSATRQRKIGFDAISPARTAAFSAARTVAWTRLNVAGVTGRPAAACWPMIALNMACTFTGCELRQRDPAKVWDQVAAHMGGVAA